MRVPTVLSACLPAAVLVAVLPVSAQLGGQAVCLQGTTGALNCSYDSLAQCQQFVSDRSLAGNCISNPAQLTTTGRGGIDAARGLEAPRGSGPNSMDRVPMPAR